MEGLSDNEVSEVLDISLTAVKSRLQRAIIYEGTFIEVFYRSADMNEMDNMISCEDII